MRLWDFVLKPEQIQNRKSKTQNPNFILSIPNSRAPPMMVVMKAHATPEMIERMTRRVEELGMKPHVIVGVERTVIAAAGPERNGVQADLEACEEVEKVV